MNAGEFIADRIAALEESVQYFSSDKKPERERWVVDALLENLNIPHTDGDIKSPEQDPPDVLAFGGRFEIKEILDPGRKRHQEYKEELKRVRTITNPKDLFTSYTRVDSSVAEILHLCSIELQKLESKYPIAVKRDLDLLFYINLVDVFKVQESPFPDTSGLASFGWRSVSFVKGQIACCFYAGAGAPEWLKSAEGSVVHKSWQQLARMELTGNRGQVLCERETGAGPAFCLTRRSV